MNNEQTCPHLIIRS